MAGYGLKPEVGHVLEERYLLEKVIGEGGMGVVFLARHIELGEQVAVKVLHSSAAMDDEHLERFLREARLAAKIKNDHVVRVIDVARGRNGSPPYIVMEFLEGFDLSDLLSARGPLPAMEAVDYLLQACEAVVEAHAVGIVHRDLKPSNLLLTRRPDGAPLLKVLDFGISKTHDDEDSKLTTTNAVFGSPAYMSPEQIRSAKHVDQRSDVWALAVVLFELITGRLPFIGDSASAILAAVAADPPLPLGRYARHPVPVGLEQVVEKCLVKDRDRRVSGISELALLLAPFASSAGLVSVEAVRRFAERPAATPRGAAASNSFPPPAASSRNELFDPTVRVSSGPYSLPSSAPAASGRPSASDPLINANAGIGRTDRGMVVASRRNLKSRTSIVAGIAVVGVAVLLAVGTFAFQRHQAKAKAAAAAAAAAASTTSVAVASANDSPKTSESNTTVGALGAPPPPSAVVLELPPSSSATTTGTSTTTQRNSHGQVRHGHPGHPTTAATPPSPPGATSALPSSPSPPSTPAKPNDIDTNSRQ